MSNCKPYIRNTKPKTTSLGKIIATKKLQVPILTVAISKMCVRGRSLVGTAGSTPVGVMDILCECCELSVRGRCIKRSPTDCGVSECDREISKMRSSWPNRGCCTMKKKIPKVTLCLGKPKRKKISDHFYGKCWFIMAFSGALDQMNSFHILHSSFFKAISTLSSYLLSNRNK